MKHGHGQQKLDKWQWNQFKTARIGCLYELKSGEYDFGYQTQGARFLGAVHSMKKHEMVEMPFGIYMLVEAYLIDEQLSLVSDVSETVRAYVLKFLTPEEKFIEAKFPTMKSLFSFLDDNFIWVR